METYKPISALTQGDETDFEKKLRTIRSNLCKIGPSNYDIISNSILEINILSNIDERKDAIDFTPEEITQMTKVVKIFIEAATSFRISGCNEGLIIPNTIANLFMKLRDKWAGHQGRVLSSVMVNYIGKYLKNYCENSPELSELEKLKYPQIILFTGMLYNRGMFQTKYCMGILLKFMNKDDQNISVFCNLLSICFDKLTSEKEVAVFNLKKSTFETYLQECKAEKSGKIRYLAMDALDLFKKI